MDERQKTLEDAEPGTASGFPDSRSTDQLSDSNVSSVGDVVSFVKNLCLTFSHLSLYPPNHPVAIVQIKKSWNELQPVFEKYGDLSITLTEGKLLFFGMPVEESNPVISKFSHHFESLHIHSIKFKQGIDSREFFIFFRLFSQDHRLIEEQGGIEALLKANKIENIAFNAAVYKVISEDEKIVKKSEVYKGETGNEEESKTEVLRYFLGKILDQAQDEKHLLDEIKNNPEGLASQIVKIVEELGSGGKYDRDSMVEALIQNIQMVSDTLGKSDSDVTVEQETVANAMMLLENELNRKSRRLSSSSSISFIKRITDVVSSYTEKAKAGKILDEFLKHEKSLKSAERMMKDLNVSGDSGSRILEKVRELMKDRDMKEDELIDYLDKSIEVRKKRKKTSKEFAPLADRIKSKLETEFKDIKDKGKLVDYLENVYSREIGRMVQEKTKDLELQVSKAKELVADVRHLFDDTNIGIVILDHDGKVSVMEHSDKLPFDIAAGEVLPETLTRQLSEFKKTGSLQLGNCTVWQVTTGDDGSVKSLLFQFT